MAWVEQVGEQSWRVRYRNSQRRCESQSGFGSVREAERFAGDLETLATGSVDRPVALRNSGRGVGRGLDRDNGCRAAHRGELPALRAHRHRHRRDPHTAPALCNPARRHRSRPKPQVTPSTRSRSWLAPGADSAPDLLHPGATQDQHRPWLTIIAGMRKALRPAQTLEQRALSSGWTLGDLTTTQTRR